MFSVSLCNTIKNAYGRVSGVIPAQSKPAIIFRNTALTSLTLTTTSNFTVAFLGTANGRLKKVTKLWISNYVEVSLLIGEISVWYRIRCLRKKCKHHNRYLLLISLSTGSTTDYKKKQYWTIVIHVYMYHPSVQ